MKEQVILSKRLYAVARLVTPGNIVCDVGCDHGFVPIYLIQKKISPRVLAMDVKIGPLERAKEHIQNFHLEDYIETRISDGLSAYRSGEADSLICAGMGGKLMGKILEADIEKTASFQELILQPQSDVEQFRRSLRRQGYLFVEENMIEEDGKFYPMMKVVQGTQKSRTLEEGFEEDWYSQMEDRYGPILLKERNPVLFYYLKREKKIYEEILKQLRGQGLDTRKRNERSREVEHLLQDCSRVMQMFTDINEA